MPKQFAHLERVILALFLALVVPFRAGATARSDASNALCERKLAIARRSLALARRSRRRSFKMRRKQVLAQVCEPRPVLTHRAPIRSNDLCVLDTVPRGEQEERKAERQEA